MPKAKMLRLRAMFGPILLKIAGIIYEPSITAHGATIAATITTFTKIQVTSTQSQLAKLSMSTLIDNSETAYRQLQWSTS